jgi:ATP synthase protein I
MVESEDTGTHRAAQRMQAEVARRAERRERARRERDRGIWFSLGLLGVVGWSVTIPALLGVALGTWIDGRWPSRVSWTLTLLLLGIVLGGVNAWRWVQGQSQDE